MFLYGYAVVSVKVNTTDCDSVNMGSIPILLPKDNCLVNSAVECLPYKEKVGSSILSQGTSYAPLVQRMRIRCYERRDGGSIPSWGTSYGK